MRGPFGAGFSAGPGRALLVGGGYGAAPLAFLARVLLACGTKVEAALGARGADDLLFVKRFHSLGAAVHAATEDGSAGARGLITEVVGPLLRAGGIDRLYACGPEAMLDALAALCGETGVPAELSYEAYMRCGIGICGSCEHGERLVCRDGPVFSMPGEPSGPIMTARPFYRKNDVTIVRGDVLSTRALAAESIDLIVTSPPYNVDIKYGRHDDALSYPKYLEFSRRWLGRCYEWLRDDGRLCLNVPLDKNKDGQQSVGADLTCIAKEIGFRYHSTIIWNEGNISRRTAWGSWMSASAPYVIAPVELIVILYRKHWKRSTGSGQSDIDRRDFMDWTNGLWTFNGESRKRTGHPAPFPLELPRRCIKLFSFVGDTILDPFMGSGTTVVAAAGCGRKAVGIEIEQRYCSLARARVEKAAH